MRKNVYCIKHYSELIDTKHHQQTTVKSSQNAFTVSQLQSNHGTRINDQQENMQKQREFYYYA